MNHTILRDLEEYSKLLFHKWFIDFNFPNEKGLPYRKSGGNFYVHNGKLCPKDWTWSPLGRYISFQKGIYYVSGDIDEASKGIPMVNLDSFTKYGGYKTRRNQITQAHVIEQSTFIPLIWLLLVQISHDMGIL